MRMIQRQWGTRYWLRSNKNMAEQMYLRGWRKRCKRCNCRGIDCFISLGVSTWTAWAANAAIMSYCRSTIANCRQLDRRRSWTTVSDAMHTAVSFIPSGNWNVDINVNRLKFELDLIIHLFFFTREVGLVFDLRTYLHTYLLYHCNSSGWLARIYLITNIKALRATAKTVEKDYDRQPQ